MAERGDILQLRRRLGFGADRAGERVVVVQATQLNAALPTLVVVPLDDRHALAAQRYVVRLPAVETGATTECVAVATHLMTVRADRLEPGRVGRLRPATMARLDQALRLVLQL